MKRITRRQNSILAFVCGYIDRAGVSPTVREIQEGLELKHVGTVQRALAGLETKGYVIKSRASRRNIVVIRGYEQKVERIAK